MIVAAAENDVIGDGGRLPWHLGSDLARFKELTMGHHLVMGRKTWDSIGRALPGRTTIVLSRGEPSLPEGVHQARSLREAYAIAREAGDDEVFVAGGGDIYRQALPEAHRVYRTRVHTSVRGDVRFPELPAGAWVLTARQRHQADERNEHDYSFETFERASPGD